MKQITSMHNADYKELKSLATSAKARRQESKTLLEGVHLTQSYLDAELSPEQVIVSSSALSNDEVMAVVARCEQQGVLALEVSDQQFRALSAVSNGIGVLFVITPPAHSSDHSLDISAVLLDGVQDPGNVGAIIRTAAAAGVKKVYCSPTTASVWAPKVLRAAMGGHFALEVIENVDLSALISSSSIPVFATTLQGEQTLYESDLSQPAAWILGNEGQGVSPSLLTDNVTQVLIPQASGVESLNVAAATAVCLFEQRRQLMGNN